LTAIIASTAAPSVAGPIAGIGSSSIATFHQPLNLLRLIAEDCIRPIPRTRAAVDNAVSALGMSFIALEPLNLA
jgi:hypothetical protein